MSTATPTVQDFLALYPGFGGFGDVAIQEALDLAATYCPAAQWKGRRRRGILLRAAHGLECDRTTEALAAAAGAEVAAGRANVASAAVPDDLSSTRYGQQFESLRRSLPSRIGRPIT